MPPEPVLMIAARQAVLLAIRSAKVSVVYAIEGDDDLEFTAGLGPFRSETEDLDGQAVAINLSEMVDLIAWPGDLTKEPEQGDTVAITMPDGQTLNFEVIPIPPEPCWRWTDRFRTARRVHLREV